MEGRENKIDPKELVKKRKKKKRKAKKEKRGRPTHFGETDLRDRFSGRGKNIRRLNTIQMHASFCTASEIHTEKSSALMKIKVLYHFYYM